MKFPSNTSGPLNLFTRSSRNGDILDSMKNRSEIIERFISSLVEAPKKKLFNRSHTMTEKLRYTTCLSSFEPMIGSKNYLVNNDDSNIHKINDADYRKESHEFFKSLLKATTGQKVIDDDVLTEMLVKIKNSGPVAKDETYLQVLKQINQCPFIALELLYWKIFNSLAAHFHPSKELHHVLLELIKTINETNICNWNPLSISENADSMEFIDQQISLLTRTIFFRLSMSDGGSGENVHAHVTRKTVSYLVKAPLSGLIFGADLKTQALVEKQILFVSMKRPVVDLDLLFMDESSKQKIPLVFQLLVSWIINLKGPSWESIYRTPGPLEGIKSLKMRFEMGKFTSAGNTDAKLIAFLLKEWLRLLPDSLIPRELMRRYSVRLAQNKINDHEMICRDLVQDLQPENKETLTLFARLAHHLTSEEHAECTKMNIREIAITVEPDFFRELIFKETNLLAIRESVIEKAEFLSLILVNLSMIQDDPVEIQ